MVHQYVSTGKVGSKFGLDAIALNRVLHILSSDECPVHVVGLHCHLGSTITNSDVLRYIFCNIYCPSGFLQGKQLYHNNVKLHMSRNYTVKIFVLNFLFFSLMNNLT